MQVRVLDYDEWVALNEGDLYCTWMENGCDEDVERLSERLYDEYVIRAQEAAESIR